MKILLLISFYFCFGFALDHTSNKVRNDLADVNLTRLNDVNITYVEDINSTSLSAFKILKDIIAYKENISDKEALFYFEQNNLERIAQSPMYSYFSAFSTIVDVKVPPFSIIYRESLQQSFRDKGCSQDIFNCFISISKDIVDYDIRDNTKFDRLKILKYLISKPGVATFRDEVKSKGYTLPLIVEATIMIKDMSGNVVDKRNQFFDVQDLARLNKLADESGIKDAHTKEEVLFLYTTRTYKMFYLDDEEFEVRNELSSGGNNNLTFVYKNSVLDIFIETPFEFKNGEINSFTKINSETDNSNYTYDLDVREVYIKSEAI